MKDYEFQKAAESMKEEELQKLRRDNKRLKGEIEEASSRVKEEEQEVGRLASELEREKKQKGRELKEVKE